MNSAFSSSVNMKTSGTSNTSCSQRVNCSGMVWPRCRLPELGPRPVYRKKGSPFSCLSRIRSKSRWLKKRPRRSQRCGLWLVTRSNRSRSFSSMTDVFHFLGRPLVRDIARPCEDRTWRG